MNTIYKEWVIRKGDDGIYEARNNTTGEIMLCGDLMAIYNAIDSQDNYKGV